MQERFSIQNYNRSIPVGSEIYFVSENGKRVERRISGVTVQSPLGYIESIAATLDTIASCDLIPPEQEEPLMEHMLFIADRLRERQSEE